MEKVKELVGKYPNRFRFIGKTANVLVERAENELGVTFPMSFKEYLETWGVIEFDSSEFYGIIGSDFVHSSVPDFVWFNKTIRKSQSIPDYLVIFRNIDGIVYYCLDTSKMNSEGECPVVVWDVPASQLEETYDMNFGEFLLDCIEEAVDPN
jgi:antitoxin YobK